MMKEPWFWRDRSFAARAVAASLEPGAFLYEAAQRWRIAHAKAKTAPVPVFCVGNATLGGVGKTPFALLLERLLREQGIAAHFLTRGYGGTARGPLRVEQRHDARLVGDEALLLAAQAPAWVARDRPAGAAAAAAAGAQAIVMDDGFQNPSLRKTLSFLLGDAEDGYGNERIFPAGPLREPVASARARADALVSVVRDKAAPAPSPEEEKPHFRAWLEPAKAVAGRRLFAFCGIGRPQRFFDALTRAGAELAGTEAFADHHPYRDADIGRVKLLAAKAGAEPITTEKDFVRIPQEARAGVGTFPVRMAVDDPDRLAALMLHAARDFRSGARHD